MEPGLMNRVDILLLALYFVLILAVGVWSTCRKAREMVKGSFLAGRNTCWLPIMARTSSSSCPTTGKRSIAIIALAAVLIAVIVAFAVVATQLHQSARNTVTARNINTTCPSSIEKINTDPPKVLPPFHDLTQEENDAVRTFLYQQEDLKLVKPMDIRVNRSYIYIVELHPPDKQATLDYLDKGTAQPEREAKVVLFLGSEDPPIIQEYIVGPLPRPVYKKPLSGPILYNARPFTLPEYLGAVYILKDQLQKNANHILQKSYGGQVGDCGTKCIDVKFLSNLPPSVSGQPNTRKIWFRLCQDVEYPLLHPIDFEVLMELGGKTHVEYTIERVVYHGQVFNSLQSLVTAYEEGKLQLTRIPFPDNNDKLYSSMHQRGSYSHNTDQRPPEQLEPDGVRYSVNGRHISYFGWDFDIRMSSISGPQLYDIRFNNERIVYELSLQDIAVFYSGHNPQTRFAAYVDSEALIGRSARTLVPGVDCPKGATMLSSSHGSEASDTLIVRDRSFCVFEHNTGVPLRRHVSPSGQNGKFYEGLLDYVLIVRTISTIDNYDYIIDFIFHQNGAINVKVISTGYIVTSFRLPEEDPYGWQLRDHVTGNIHHHMFNFKVDLDIKGQSNRFETLDIEPVAVDNTKWSVDVGAKHFQTKFTRNLKRTEADATLKYDFNAPKYLTFYNDQFRSKHDVPRAYRVLIKGMSKQVLQENYGQEPSISWARYQLAVTKRKETEQRSSSFYGVWDGLDPVVNFEKFISDNESIVDEDQVAWVTMGIHHIPHMEDLPVTHTAGLDLNFYLIPNNYFDEDPAMASRDAIRIDPIDQSDLSKGVRIKRYRKAEKVQCSPPESTFDQDANNNPGILFDE